MKPNSFRRFWADQNCSQVDWIGSFNILLPFRIMYVQVYVTTVTNGIFINTHTHLWVTTDRIYTFRISSINSLLKSETRWHQIAKHEEHQRMEFNQFQTNKWMSKQANSSIIMKWLMKPTFQTASWFTFQMISGKSTYRLHMAGLRFPGSCKFNRSCRDKSRKSR